MHLITYLYIYDDDENRASSSSSSKQMEMDARELKSSSNKKKLMKYLPRAMTFQNHALFSPGREPKPARLSDAYKNRAHTAQNRGFSGQLISLVPIEARKKERGGKRNDGGFDSDAEEPRSPKVSCIGQIKYNKKLHKLKREESKKERLESKPPADKSAKKKPNLGLGNIFRLKRKSGSVEKVKETAQAPPGLSQMKRFSSGRDAFANFDWTKQQVTPVAEREYYSDDDERIREWDDDDESEDDVMIAYSAPMMIGGGIQLEPRKEICLWKKRNMPPPKPLELNIKF